MGNVVVSGMVERASGGILSTLMKLLTWLELLNLSCTLVSLYKNLLDFLIPQ